MGNKKLDNLFQEHLKNLEATPNKRVWNNIEAQLAKKKRKVLPIWWLSGAIATILVALTFINPFSKDDSQFLNIDNQETTVKIPKQKPILKNTVDSLNLQIESDNEILISKTKYNLKIDDKQISSSSIINKEKIIKLRADKSFMLVNHLPININLNVNQQDLLSQNIEIKSNTIKKELLDIRTVIKNNTKDISSKDDKNWSVAPVFGVIQSNSLTDTSPLNSSLAKSTSGQRSYTYGMQVSYKINEKWSIQSGIHQQDMNYANNQVAVNPSSQNNPFATAFADGAALSFDSALDESISLTSNFIAIVDVSDTGNVVQNYGYIEVPIEVKYNFFNNNKIETQLVTGFSTLFLNKNEVSVSTQNFSSDLVATNLNNINFSGNLGFDFNYSFNKQWSFNLNPMFKIQLNTFSDNANGFTPINLGLYSGIRYQF